MTGRSFLSSLLTSGRVEVDELAAGPGQLADNAEELLPAFDRLARQELAFTAPEFVPEAAEWAAGVIYRGCQFLVYRRLDEHAMNKAFEVACPRPLSAGVVYSADLLLRYLADLVILARAAAERDVLVAELLRIGSAWPLSSVGIPRLAANQLDPRAVEIIMADRCLRQLYIDRVIARRDLSRLAHCGTRDGVREALGLYDELWPEAIDR